MIRFVCLVLPRRFASSLGLPLLAATLGAALLLAAPARAGMVYAAHGGVFQAWQDVIDGDSDVGFEVGAQVMYQFRFPLRVGGELSWRRFQTEIFDTEGVDVDSARIGVVAHFTPVRDGLFRPYVGGTYQFAVNVLDTDDIEKRRRFKGIDEVGTGSGIAAILGLEIPLGGPSRFYVEGRIGGDLYLTNVNDDWRVENLGGLSGLAGLRLAF